MGRPVFQPGMSFTALTGHYQLISCDGSACDRGWNRLVHERGRLDNAGHIHFDHQRQMTRHNLRMYLMAIAPLWLDHERRRPPSWLVIYERNVWAATEARYTWKVRIPGRYSDSDRARAWRKAARDWLDDKTKLRTEHHAFYQWAWYKSAPPRGDATRKR